MRPAIDLLIVVAVGALALGVLFAPDATVGDVVRLLMDDDIAISPLALYGVGVTGWWLRGWRDRRHSDNDAA